MILAGEKYICKEREKVKFEDLEGPEGLEHEVHIREAVGDRLWFGNWVSLYSGGSRWFSQCKNMLDFHCLVEVIWTGVLMCVD